MKRILTVMTIVSIIFASCKKYETSEPLNFDNLETVTITGKVYADLDETTVALEPAPAGTVVKVSIPYSEYTLNSSGNQGNHIITTTVDAQGSFSVKVPVISSGINATISFQDFTHKVKTYNNYGYVEEFEKHFSCNDITFANLGSANGEGDHIKIDVQYAANQTAPNDDISLVPTHNITFSGKLTYDSEAGAPATAVAGGTVIKVSITLTGPAPASKQYKEVKEFTVASSGNYTIDIPMVERGVASISINDEQFWEYSDGTNDFIYRYILNVSESAIYNSNYNKKDYKYTRSDLINSL